MRYFFGISVVFALLILVILTPIYLKRDFEDAINETITTTASIFSETDETKTTTATDITTTTMTDEKFTIITHTEMTTTTIISTSAETETIAETVQSTTTVPTTTTEQDKQNPCPYECYNEDKCTIIVEDKLIPRENQAVGTINARRQFRMNIGIDFPAEASKGEANIVHERASINLIGSSDQ